MPIKQQEVAQRQNELSGINLVEGQSCEAESTKLTKMENKTKYCVFFYFSFTHQITKLAIF